MSDNLPATLDDLARDIRDTLERADKSQRHADDLRITAGRMLIAARQQVAARNLVWADWLKVNLPERSARDVRRLLAIAKAPDPAVAVAQDRRKAREGMHQPHRFVAAMERQAKLQIATDALQAKTAIIALGLITDAARQFLDELQPLERLMPPLELGSIEEMLDETSPRHRLLS
jgi:hypothetical protein